MKSVLTILITLIISCSCVNSQNKGIVIPLGDNKNHSDKNEAVADFSEGCFWHSEIIFQSLVGVMDAVSGYAGGSTVNPDYEKVASGTTGYAETVQVYFDTTKISYSTLVKAFFASHDPTTLNK